MMDVSDGLLIDAARMAEASGAALAVDLAALPLSPAYISIEGEDRRARLDAATAGDDYELLFAAPPASAAPIVEISEALSLPFRKLGRFREGSGIRLFMGDEELCLPDRLGWDHRTG